MTPDTGPTDGGAGSLAITRLALRSVRRDRRRSLLIVALLALPVAIAIVVAAGQRAIIASPEEQRAQYYGQADVFVEGDLRYLAGLFVDGEPGPDAAYYLDELDFDPAALEDVAAAAQRLTSDDIAAAVAAEAGGAPVTPFVQGIEFGIGRDSVEVLGLDATDPLTDGIVTIDAGRAPGNGEAALTENVAELLDAEIGDVVDVGNLGPLTIGGLFRRNSWADARAVLVPPAEVGDSGRTTWLIGPWEPRVDDDAYGLAHRVTQRLVGPESAPLAREAGAFYSQTPQASFTSDGRTAVLQLNRPPVLAGFVTAAVLLVVALIAAAAFATGARRRVREFGLMATIGADPDHIRRLVLTEAAILGAVAVAAGIGLGLVGVAAATPLIERLADHVVDGVGASAADIVAPALVGTAGAVLAAWWPARSIARVPVLTALNGRVPQRPLRARVVPLAALLLAVGLMVIGVSAASLNSASQSGDGDVQVLAMILGCLLCLAGAALGATWVTGFVARHAERLPLGARLVARDAGRQQFRTAVSVAGLVVILAAPVMVMATAITAENADRATYQAAARPDEVVLNIQPIAPTSGDVQPVSIVDTAVLAEAEAAIDRIVPVRDAGSVAGLAPANRDGEPAAGELFGAQGVVWADVVADDRSNDPGSSVSGGWVGLGTPEAVAALRLPAEAADLLAAGTAVTTGARSGSADVQWCEAGGQGACDGTDIAVVGFPGRERIWSEPAVLLPPSMVAELGLVAVEQAEVVVFVADEPLTAAQRDAIDAATVFDFDTGTSTFADIEGVTISASTHDPFRPFAGLVAAIALPTALVIVLVLGGCLVAIAATESDRDVATMVRVGAAPSLRRRFSGLQGWYHAALGAVLGAPIGLLVLVALRSAYDEPAPLALPWTTLASVVVAIPVVLGVVVMALTRSTPPRPASGR